MKTMKRLALWTTVMLFCLMFALPSSAQFREYYIHGKVVDGNKTPIVKVDIKIREVSTSRSYSRQTNKKGVFTFVVIPHGVYKAVFSKEGYQTMELDWMFQTPQNRMQKVEVDTVVLTSEEQVANIKLSKKLQKLMDDAKDLIRNSDIDGAIGVLQKMLAEKPGETNANYLLGICYLKKNLLEKAGAAFMEVIKSNPKFAPGHIQMGVVHQQSKRFEEAITCYKAALQLDPKNLPAIYNSGLILYSLNRYQEAVTYLLQALEIKKDDPEIMETIGLAYIKSEKYPEALKFLEKAKTKYSDQSKIKELDELIKGLKDMSK
ncbi:MAG: tetratricopeptide repeat protein [bacterium]|nr:tetratricopeptide repeat protein [bacterium]